MSNRKTLIDILHRSTSATLAELVDATGWPERKVRDTISDCKTAGLLSSERDDITGKPLYRLTKDGANWQSSVQQKKRNTTPAGGGDISPAPRDPDPKAVTPQGARGVVEPPKQAAKPAEARSDEKPAVRRYYAVAMQNELFESPESAMAAIEGDEVMHSHFVVECRVVGRIELRPLMVPIGG